MATDTFDPVDLVHQQLECLKYVGGIREQFLEGEKVLVPTGQGLEIGIALLPDLLLDVRKQVFSAKKRGRILAVGGRAARTACALMHLLGEDNGAFCVHLITKTGNLGQMLLENEFLREDFRRGVHPLYPDTVVIRIGDPRCAILPEGDSGPEPAEPIPRDELSAADLDDPDMADAIRSSRTVCLSSIKTPDFVNLYKRLLACVTREGQGIFVDAARATKPSLKQLLEQLARTPVEDRKKKILGVFLDRAQEDAFLEVSGYSSVSAFSERTLVRIIEYGEYGDGKRKGAGQSAGVAHVDREGHRTEVRCAASFRHENIPECFKAGILLASSLHRAIGDLRERNEDPCQEVYRHLSARWPLDDSSCWRIVLQYGASLAEAGMKTDASKGAGTMDAQAGHARKDGSMVYPPDLREHALTLTMRPYCGSKELALLQGELPSLVNLAHLRRRGNGPACEKLGLCSSPRCRTVCPKGKQVLPTPPAAVLIDLDGTLMDSTEQRDRALAAALRELAKPIHKVRAVMDCKLSQREQVAFLTGNVYDLWRLYGAMGLGDFRQEWNTAGWYVTFILYLERPGLHQQVLRTWNSLTKDEQNDARAVSGRVKEAGLKTPFVKAYREMEEAQRDAVRKAQHAFAAVNLRPFKDARDFLRTLQNVGAFSLYVVSEGNPETQWFKVKSTGLDEFFPRSHVLTTGDAADPVDARKALAREISKLDKELMYTGARLRGLRERARHQALMFTDILQGLSEAHVKAGIDVVQLARNHLEKQLWAEIDDLQRRRTRREQHRKAAYFVEKVLARLEKKETVSFYATAIRAILRKPHAPLGELRQFGRLLEGNERGPVTMKFAMIGDRQTNDIEPSLRLLGRENLLTIRLLAGKYACKERPDGADALAPAYVAHTLAQAKAILLSKACWGMASCVGDPPLFNWEIDLQDPDRGPDDGVHIGLNCVLNGIEMPNHAFPTIHSVCAGVLAEQLRRWKTPVRDSFLGPYLRPGPNASVQHTPSRRARVLSAIVLAGALNSPPLLDRQSAVVDALGQLVLSEKSKLNNDDMNRVRQALGTLAAGAAPDVAKAARRILQQMDAIDPGDSAAPPPPAPDDV